MPTPKWIDLDPARRTNCEQAKIPPNLTLLGHVLHTEREMLKMEKIKWPGKTKQASHLKFIRVSRLLKCDISLFCSDFLESLYWQSRQNHFELKQYSCSPENRATIYLYLQDHLAARRRKIERNRNLDHFCAKRPSRKLLQPVTVVLFLGKRLLSAGWDLPGYKQRLYKV